MLGLAFVFGVMLVIPIGSADMPVVMSLLNLRRPGRSRHGLRAG